MVWPKRVTDLIASEIIRQCEDFKLPTGYYRVSLSLVSSAFNLRFIF